MADINFDGGKATNLGDARFEKDGVNLRTAKRMITSGTTIFTANTIYTQGIQFLEPATIPAPSSGLMWFSANTLYIYTGNTSSDLRVL